MGEKGGKTRWRKGRKSWELNSYLNTGESEIGVGGEDRPSSGADCRSDVVHDVPAT